VIRNSIDAIVDPRRSTGPPGPSVLLCKSLSINRKSNSDDGAVIPRGLSTEEECSRFPAPLAAEDGPEAKPIRRGPARFEYKVGKVRSLGPIPAPRDSRRMRATMVRHADFRREHSRSSAESRLDPASARRIARRNPRGHPYLSPLSIIHLFILFRSRSQVRERGIAPISESDTIAAIGEALANRVIPFVESATIC